MCENQIGNNREVCIRFWVVKSSGNHFHFLKEPFDMFRFTITELKYRTLCVRKTWPELLEYDMAKFSKSSGADVPFMSKRKRQNDFLAS